ncbi:MAG: GH3 auxin-responsive promoter family protein [Bacteroidetes bacterium]|nr:GH3 auxin-responsive promoter family protein [Bacteroidota bacterium]
MALINSVISWLMKQRIHQIELFMKYPLEVQSDWLKNLLVTARNTEWGKKYDFRSIDTPEKFRNIIPLNDYDSLKPSIERLRKGEQNILWPTEIKWFAKSSGTTSDKSKYIPVSMEALEECHFKGGKDLLSIYCSNHPESIIFDGLGIAMGGSHHINEINNESYYYEGDLSAIIIQNLPFWVEYRRTPGLSIALMDEWESKIDKMARATLSHNVTSCSGVPSWTLLLFRRVLEISGKQTILDVWPNFELFIHGGVNFGPYRDQFRNLFSDRKVNYLEVYNASEGFFGIQDRNETEDMLLMLDYGIYYEFIPIEEIGSDNPKVLTLGEVESGPNYAMVITTNGGLWRYIIGDTVTFTTLDPYRIKITGRTRNFINAFGEELIIDNAEKAIAIACERCNAMITEYTVAPVYLKGATKGAHEWLIEFEKPPENIGYFTNTLDNALKSLNSDYEAKRYCNMILNEPLVHVMPSNTFYNWLKSKGRLGGQYKVPRLANERKYVDEILAMVEMDPKEELNNQLSVPGK